MLLRPICPKAATGTIRRNVINAWRAKIDTAETMSTISTIVTYAALGQGGERLREKQNRRTWVLIRQDGSWRISHAHGSAPIHPHTLKAMLCKE